MPKLFRVPKKQGEWAELKFMVRASEFGLSVSKPWGDCAPYDLIVSGRDGRLQRVQVRSTSHYNGGYRCGYTRARSSGSPTFTAREIDFLAVYVIPMDTWYVVPQPVVGATKVVIFYPHIPHSRGRLESYREAWHLLTHSKDIPPPAQLKKNRR
ncbi:MAG: group I intron-associated PD-(D/E)XK endonuclease [Terriglobales bacterium]